VVGRDYTLQSTTNLASSAWFTETNFIAATMLAAITNSTSGYAEKFYRLVGY